jgi:hypothetical protein
MLHDLSKRTLEQVLVLSWLHRQSVLNLRRLDEQIALVKQRMAKRRKDAAARIFALAAQAASARGSRRHIDRATGKWRGSTIGGYVRTGDDRTYEENFRMSRETFKKLLELVSKSSFASQHDAAEWAALRAKKKQQKLTQRERTYIAQMHTDPPTTRFKLAVCLYAMAQGGRFKQVGDAASIGKNTVRGWMVAFCQAVMTHVKPIYMPGTPFSPSERQAVNGKFASRRGVQKVALACDGSHVPYHPRGSKKKQEKYKNYKGWTSILAVCFVDSYYRFFDLHVGYPGRAGDNTVLSHWSLLQQMAEDPDTWLGPNGIILGDCGASDGDQLFLNPYHNPSEPDQCWFNFCHSSTRFFVEETFGRWKNRWRFLLDPCRVNHKLTSQMIYASAVLHNFCTVHADSDFKLPAQMTDLKWQEYFHYYDATSCPTCKRRNAPHCVHQGAYRMGETGAVLRANARRAPSTVRNELCAKLWDMVCSGLEGRTFDDRAFQCLDAEEQDATVREQLCALMAARASGGML